MPDLDHTLGHVRRLHSANLITVPLCFPVGGGGKCSASWHDHWPPFYAGCGKTPLVKGFLGRDASFDAFRDWLNAQ